MHGKTDPTVRSRTATKEQLRMAQVTQDGTDEDRSRIQKMIREIIETTRCSQSQAEIALHDASNNVEAAVNNILESSTLDTWSWSHSKNKGSKSKEDERDGHNKKGGNRPPRRGNQNQRDLHSKGARAVENGNEGRENRQPREKDDDGFRSSRNQQPRNRREPGAKRDYNKKANANASGDSKDEGDDYWKNGPLVFSRRENIEEKELQQVSEPTNKPVSQANAAGPLSFADVVRKSAQKPPPAVLAAPDASYKLQVSKDAKQTSSSPHNLNDGLRSAAEAGFGSVLPETSKSPRSHHLDLDSTGNLLRDDAPAVVFGTQPSPQKLQQSLTDQLKNDLGLGITPNNTAFVNSSKKYQEPLHQTKLSTVKAGVVEFLSGEAPTISSGEWQFGFEATSAPQNAVNEEHQFRRENVSKVNESVRNDIGLPSTNINESNAPRGNASTVLNQYVQQQNSQPPYNHQQQFNRNRNGVNNLPFSNNYSDNFNPDLRSNSYGAPSSPPKSQTVQQPLQNLVSQQIPSQQQSHHHQQPIFPPTQLPYPNYQYMNMYSPVAPGLRDDFTPLMPFHQYNLNQTGLDALMVIPQLANATSAGPLPTQHHQNSHPQQQSVQQGLQQHSQNSHSQSQQQSHQRNEHYNDMKFLNQMSIPPAPASQQNNGANGHNPQQNSNLGSNQQRQQLLENNSQNSVGGNIPPPPGFSAPPSNLPAGPFMQQRMFQQSFQVPAFTQQFPYVMPSAQHKSK